MINLGLPMLAAISSSFSGAKASIMPLVFAALLLDSVMISAWYLFGLIINDDGVKVSARNEFYQLIGTALIAAIVISLLGIFSGFFFSLLNTTHLLSTGTVSSLCTGILSTSNLGIINNSGYSNRGSLSGGGGSVLKYICDNYISGSSSDLTYEIGYPLATTSVIIANLTNQTASNINNLFITDSWVGFLSQLSPYFGICVSGDQVEAINCLIPDPEPPPLFQLEVNFKPYAGLDIITHGFQALGVLLTSSYESFLMQLIFTAMFLFIWPIILFVGFVLRATPFTRKLGGLFIAIAIGAVIFYPAIFSIEYLTLGNGLANVPNYGNTISTNPQSIASIYGFNTITTNALTSIPGYTLNFYVEPRLNDIALANSCWPNSSDKPPQGGAINGEALTDIDLFYIPFYSLADFISSLYSGFVSSYPNFSLFGSYFNQCQPTSAQSTLFAFLNAYGPLGITSYILPIMNIIIVITAVIGLSSLFGGDTELAGLSKLI